MTWLTLLSTFNYGLVLVYGLVLTAEIAGGIILIGIGVKLLAAGLSRGALCRVPRRPVPLLAAVRL